MNRVRIRARIAGAMLIIITIFIIIISIELFVRTPPVKINDIRYNVIEIEGMTCISGPASLTCNWDKWDKRE